MITAIKFLKWIVDPDSDQFLGRYKDRASSGRDIKMSKKLVIKM